MHLQGLAQQDSVQYKSYALELQLFSHVGTLLSSAKDAPADYDISRTLLIYKQKLFQDVEMCLAVDSYENEDNNIFDRTVYLKRGFLKYQKNKLAVSGGLIVMRQYLHQRKLWQLRYLEKTFQNKFKYGDSRNIGLQGQYKWNSNNSSDFAIVSGYNTPLKDNAQQIKVMAGHIIYYRDYTVRLFNSLVLEDTHVYVASLFISRKWKKMLMAVESASQFSNHASDRQLGFSAFAHYMLTKKSMCFARYDHNKQHEDSDSRRIGWIGWQYAFSKKVLASLYHRMESDKHAYLALALYVKL